jgi:hypothetical protein
MAVHHRAGRNGRQGIVLLAVLAGVVLIAAIAGTLRARAGATSAVLGRLAEVHRVALAEVSVANRARAGGLVAGGTPVEVVRDGYRFEVRVTDVEGLVDLYLSPGPVLRLLTARAGIVAARDGMLAGLTPGDRYLSEVQTMAVMGLDAAERARLMPLVTQRARTGEINPALAPAELRGDARLLAEQDIAGGDLAKVSVRLLP